MANLNKLMDMSQVTNLTSQGFTRPVGRLFDRAEGRFTAAKDGIEARFTAAKDGIEARITAVKEGRFQENISQLTNLINQHSARSDAASGEARQKIAELEQQNAELKQQNVELQSANRRNRVELENEREERIAGHKHHSDTLWDMRTEIATFKIQARDQQNEINAAYKAEIKELKKDMNRMIKELKREIKELKQATQHQEKEEKQPARRSERIAKNEAN